MAPRRPSGFECKRGSLYFFCICYTVLMPIITGFTCVFITWVWRDKNLDHLLEPTLFFVVVTCLIRMAIQITGIVGAHRESYLISASYLSLLILISIFNVVHLNLKSWIREPIHPILSEAFYWRIYLYADIFFIILCVPLVSDLYYIQFGRPWWIVKCLYSSD